MKTLKNQGFFASQKSKISVKILSLLLMAMFLVSLVPAAFAVQGNENKADSPEPTGYVVGGDREEFVAKAEQRRQDLLEKREGVVAARTRQRLNVANKREELLRRFQENKAEMIEKVAKAIQKRTEAIEKFREAKVDLAKNKEKLKACKGKADATCTEERRKTRKNAQKFLLNAAYRMTGLLEKARERIQKSDRLSEEEKATAIASIEARMQDVVSAQETIEATTEAATKEEVKESAKMLRETWRKANKEIKEKTAREVSGKIGGTLVKIERLQAKLERTVEKLKQKGMDTTPIEAMMQQFENKIAEGKAAHEVAMQKFQEGKANEATTNIRAAHKRIKEAHRLLKDVVRKIRKAHQGEKIREGVEPETEAEDAAERAAESAAEEAEEDAEEEAEEAEESEEEEAEETEETSDEEASDEQETAE